MKLHTQRVQEFLSLLNTLATAMEGEEISSPKDELQELKSPEKEPPDAASQEGAVEDLDYEIQDPRLRRIAASGVHAIYVPSLDRFVVGEPLVAVYEKLPRMFLALEAGLSDTSDESSAKHEVVDLLEIALSRPPTSADIVAAVQNLQVRDVQRWLVVFEVFEAASSEVEPIYLLPFVLLRFPEHRRRVAELFPHIRRNPAWSLFPYPSNLQLQVGVYVSSRTFDKAKELALAKMDQLQNVLAMLSEGRWVFQVFGTSHMPTSRVLGVTPKAHQGSVSINAERALDFAEVAEARKRDPFHDSIWKLIEKDSDPSQPSELENRTLLAADWLGSSFRAADPKSQLLHAVFALEAMLSKQEMGLGAPSVGQRLKEISAMLIGRDLEERLSLDRKVGTIYAARSAIAHGRGGHIDPSVVKHARQLVRSLLEKFLLDSEIKEFKDIDALDEWIRKKRYS